MGQGTSFWRGPGKVDLTLSKEIGVSLTIDFCCVTEVEKGVGRKVFNGSVKKLFSWKTCVVVRNRFVCLYNIYSK